MTNTGFVALPILQATYGPHAVLPAAIATVFVAVVMFPAAVILQELGRGGRLAPMTLARHVALNPMVLSTLAGVAWSASGWAVPGPVAAYLHILADALAACACSPSASGCRSTGSRRTFGAPRR